MSVGEGTRYSFNCWKAYSHFGVYCNFFLASRVLKKDLQQSIALEIKGLNVVTLLVKLYTSLTICGDFIARTALILLGLASVPLYCTLNPNNFSDIDVLIFLCVLISFTLILFLFFYFIILSITLIYDFIYVGNI